MNAAMRFRRRDVLHAAGMAALPLLARAARAQTFPSRIITIVVPYPAGGPTDTIARILADRMGTVLHQSVIVENISGAGGSIGVGRVARAAPDGYTLSIGHVQTHVLNAAVRETLADASVQQRFRNVGQEIWPVAEQTPQALAAKQKAEIAEWTPIVKAAGIKIDEK